MAVLPVVRYLVACEDVVVDATNPHRVHLLGVASTIRATGEPPFPAFKAVLTAFVQLTECRGPVRGRVTIVDAESGDPVTGSPEHPINLPADPLEVVNVGFRLRDLRFPAAGLYWVQFWCEDVLLQQIPLVLR